MTGRELRAKRTSANLSGQSVCTRAGVTRSRLSAIENEYVTATPAELSRITEAVDAIVETRQHLSTMAASAGLSLVGCEL
jgi:transcriptional regulator with XRE-family HTH domain